MEDTTRGHVYKIGNEGEGTQELRFVRKGPKSPEDSSLEVVEDGTTTEAVIEVLIDRLTFLDNRVESDFNKRAIQSLTDARTALIERSLDREAREVEGTNKA